MAGVPAVLLDEVADDPTQADLLPHLRGEGHLLVEAPVGDPGSQPCPRAVDGGIVGLPVVNGDNDASVLYLRNAALRLSRMGSLDASNAQHRDDDCKASCVDWYGNARPIFIGERVFALMGYELVEGRADASRITERRRVDFSPRVAVAVAN